MGDTSPGHPTTISLSTVFSISKRTEKMEIAAKMIGWCLSSVVDLPFASLEGPLPSNEEVIELSAKLEARFWKMLEATGFRGF